MQRLWDSYDNLAVAGNFLYLPLVLDPSVARELESHPPVKLSSAQASNHATPFLIEAQGSVFVQTVSLDSLLEHYGAVDPETCESLRRELLEDLGPVSPPASPAPDPNLAVILFQIMPHFLRRSRSLARENLDPEEILRLVSKRVRLPAEYSRRTGNPAAFGNLEEAISRLSDRLEDPGPPPAGLISASALKQWFLKALTAKIAAREQARLTQDLAEQERWAELCRRHAGLLAYLADTGSLEVDGFGFARVRGKMRGKEEYVVYKRTGVYALKDFYGRPYIFPDCRVAVATHSRLKPFVIEHYKHPLLRRHGSNQEICVPKDFQGTLSFNAANVIMALETGLNALYYGYNARRRNGYHRLERIHQDRLVDFEDYRVPPTDPRIVSGAIEVKNIFF